MCKKKNLLAKKEKIFSWLSSSSNDNYVTWNNWCVSSQFNSLFLIWSRVHFHVWPTHYFYLFSNFYFVSESAHLYFSSWNNKHTEVSLYYFLMKTLFTLWHKVIFVSLFRAVIFFKRVETNSRGISTATTNTGVMLLKPT